MSQGDENRFSGDRDFKRWLRSGRPEVSSLQLDQIKRRAMTSSPSQPKGFTLRSRGLVASLTLALMIGGTGGVIAASSGGGDNGSAAKSQYRPGKGCGDKNHIHERFDECKDNGNK